MALEDLVISANIPISLKQCEIVNQDKVVVVPGGLDSPTIEIILRDANGNPIDLTTEAADDAYVFKVEAREAINGGTILFFDAEVHTPSAGSVRSALSTEITKVGGVYEAGIVVYKDDKPIFVYPFWILIERNIRDDNAGRHGPPLLRDIQRELADNVFRNITGILEFSDEDLISAMITPVREWNETPPDIGIENTITFPWMDAWRKATVGHLLLISASSYRRNRMPTRGGSVVFDDQDKEQPYTEAAKFYLAEFKDFIERTKAERNMNLMFGATPSIYDAWHPRSS